MFKIFKKTYEFPFKYNIPYYFDEKRYLKRLVKCMRRYLYLYFNGQLKLEQQCIERKHKNILWINLSAPSLGDSLMDLSSRVLLLDKNIDLFTDKKNAHIYKNDEIFGSVIVDKNSIKKDKYDLVIIDSYSTRSIKIKINHLKNIEFVGMYGHYNGPEVNRILYSFHQMNNLLGYPLNEDEVNSRAKPYIYIGKRNKEVIDKENLPNSYIAIVLGGEWAYRTYNHWEKIIREILLINPETYMVLVGSFNAKTIATNILKKFNNKNIVDCVARYNFCQTAQIIKSADILFCCDGGLMNVANCVETPTIPLFAKQNPIMRLTKASMAFPLFDEENVNNISSEEIIKNYKKYLKISL